MASEHTPTPHLSGQLFLKLPRELRDLIYSYVVIKDFPIYLANDDVQLGISHCAISTELLEAEYTNNTFIVTFSNPNRGRKSIATRGIWGAQPEYKRFIRHLIVEATEARLDEVEIVALERECTASRPELRKEWAELLELPCLETLTINMQKYYPSKFCWANFSPIIYDLRDNIPRLRFAFNVSFDKLLAYHWYGVGWGLENQLTSDAYQTMGYVDVSELIEKPSKDDVAYVEQYLEKKIETKGRDAIDGLLSESAANKRLLGPHYVVKEAALLRVLMQEHWEVYKRAKDTRENIENVER